MRITSEHPASSYGFPVILDDDDQPLEYPEGFQAARHRLQLTTAELGELVDRSPRTIEDYEQGRRNIPAEVLYALGYLLDEQVK